MTAFDAAWERFHAEPHAYCDTHHVAHAADEHCEQCIEEQRARYAALDEAESDVELVACPWCGDWCVPYDVTDDSVCRDCLPTAERWHIPEAYR